MSRHRTSVSSPLSRYWKQIQSKLVKNYLSNSDSCLINRFLNKCNGSYFVECVHTNIKWFNSKNHDKKTVWMNDEVGIKKLFTAISMGTTKHCIWMDLKVVQKRLPGWPHRALDQILHSTCLWPPRRVGFLGICTQRYQSQHWKQALASGDRAPARISGNTVCPLAIISAARSACYKGSQPVT